MKILVVGGGGYIGSHMVKRLLQAGHSVTTLDDFSTGYRDAILGGAVVEGSLADRALLEDVFSAHKFEAVMHFASFIQVAESVREPGKYYANNVTNTLNLLDAMVTHGVHHFIFSSTAAIFGEPQYVPIDENHPVQPINPYGASKAMVERMLADYDKAYGLKSVCLRYFNACGADPEATLSERHIPETHLIPLALQAAFDLGGALTVFGRDYVTPDGTCVRDYVHVADLCEAHILALEYLQRSGVSAAFNLGNGEGFSVQQVVDAVSRETGRSVPVSDGPRRAGDPAVLVADSRLAKRILGWKPLYEDLDTIIRHAAAVEVFSSNVHRGRA